MKKKKRILVTLLLLGNRANPPKGLLNEDLFFDISAPVKFFWEPLKPIVYGQRGEFKEPKLLENFELLYERQRKWEKSHPPRVRLVTA